MVFMLLESQYSNAMQRYGKKRTYAILNQNKSLANRFLYKMCQFVYDEHVPVQDVILLFEHINALGLNIGNLNSLNYTQLKSMVDGETSKEQSFRGDALYTSPTKLVEVYYIDSFEKAQSFFSNTTWCICNNREQWNILRKNGSTFYLIVNRNFSMRSKCRFVIARVYPNGNIEYIDMSNNAIISGGGNKPNYDTYANSLEGAIQHLKPQQPIQENKQYRNTNNTVMKINESQLRKIIQESAKNVLKERSLDDIEHTDLYGYNDTEDYSEEELVKVAKSGDYTTAFIDYLKELIGPSAENLTLNSFIKDMRSGKIRYCEKNDGIYYINDWSGV